MLRLLPILCASLLMSPSAGQQVPNFKDHIEPILREHCVSCHKGSRAKNGLQLRSMKGILEGGSSGPAIVPGDAAASLLVQVISHEREPFMPPDEARLGDDVIQLFQAWIDGGARATADDAGITSPATAAATFVPPPAAGESIMPESMNTQPIWSTQNADSIVALAASPTSPLLAVGGHEQVSLYDTSSARLVGVLPFGLGAVRDLSFSASGAILIAGGGRAGDSGGAVGWDVRTGAPVFQLGDEPDVALAAAVTVDHQTVAIGGPDRVVRAYAVKSGQPMYEFDAHTDWIMDLAFSPDGVLLATADRGGAVFVLETLTGREFHALPAQKSPVTGLAWRPDSALLAVATEKGEISLYSAETGKRTRRLNAGKGVQSVHFEGDGDLVSCGRDNKVFTWGGDGKKKRTLNTQSQLLTAVCATEAGDVVVGNFEGQVRLYRKDQKESEISLRPNPRTDEERGLEDTERRIKRLEAELNQLEQEYTSVTGQLGERQQELQERSAVLAKDRQQGADETDQFMASRRKLEEEEALLPDLLPPHQRAQEEFAKVKEQFKHLEEAQLKATESLDHSLRASFTAEKKMREQPGDQALVSKWEAALQKVDEATERARVASSEAAGSQVLQRRREAELQHAAKLEQQQRKRIEVAIHDRERAGRRLVEVHLQIRKRSDQLDSKSAQVLELQQQVDRLAQARETLPAQLAEARESVARLQERWARLQEYLEGSGGRVPEAEALGALVGQQ